MEKDILTATNEDIKDYVEDNYGIELIARTDEAILDDVQEEFKISRERAVEVVESMK